MSESLPAERLDDATGEASAEASARVGSSALFVLASSAAVLAATVLTGVMTGRLLGPEGKGEVVAVGSLIVTLTWVGSLGSREAAAYLMARRPADQPSIRATALIVTLGLATLWFVVGQLILPVLFSAQPSSLVDLGRYGLLWVFIQFEYEMVLALLRGGQRFRDASVVQIVSPAALTVALFALWFANSFTVAWVVGSQAAAAGMGLLFGLWRLLVTSPLAGPESEILREGARYGKRVMFASLGSLANARLDVTILPAVVAASQIGLYSVATNAASIIAALFGSLAYVVLPIAARRGGARGMGVIERLVRSATYASLLFAVLLGVFGEFFLVALYGDAFGPAITPLRILLPGIVLWTAATLLCAGLQATGTPGLASWAQLIGLVVTIVGLAVTLSPLGINGAALTSTIAYSACFVAALLFLSRHRSFSARRAFSLRLMTHDARLLLGVVRTRQWPEGV